MKEKIKKNNSRILELFLSLIVIVGVGFFLFSVILEPAEPTTCVISKCFPKIHTYVAFFISALVIIELSFWLGKMRGKEEEGKYYRGEE